MNMTDFSNNTTTSNSSMSTTTSSTSAGFEPAEVPETFAVEGQDDENHTSGATSNDDGEPTMPGIESKKEDPDIWSAGHSDSKSESGDFWEENKDLLKQIQNILDFRYPSSNISLAELIMSVGNCISRYENNGGGVSSEDTSSDAIKKIVGDYSIKDTHVESMINAIINGVSYDDYFKDLFGDLSLKDIVLEIGDKLMRKMEG